ncbi:hypothetical protein LIER_34304 [Lithospermum erythrorhizon]|uniref:Uncharacterized protein n=1 Tax=Lithospermum erythrorhizon TaxID=34254 RepID=A0AAV3S3Z9_LITER
MEDAVSEDVVTQTIRTTYYPTYMSLFFARPSGFCTFDQTCYLSMRAPYNLAHHLLLENRPAVTIRSRECLFGDVEVTLGYFRRLNWTALVEACDFDLGFKIFFFLNHANEFEMIVVGHGNLEAVYEWARTYYKIM